MNKRGKKSEISEMVTEVDVYPIVIDVRTFRTQFGEIEVGIRGLSPLLMNRLSPEKLKPEPGPAAKTYDPEIEARKNAYITVIDGQEQLYIPGNAIYSMMVRTGSLFKTGGKSMSGILAGAIRIEPEKILLGHCNYEIYEETVTRPPGARGKRVLSWRPMVREWAPKFNIIYNKRAFTAHARSQLPAILAEGGTRYGLLDYRPQHKGGFGTFELESFVIKS